MENFRIVYLGSHEGYTVRETNRPTNGISVFASFLRAKTEAVAQSRLDLIKAKDALDQAKKIKLEDVYRD